jgi:hypothetical protein
VSGSSGYLSVNSLFNSSFNLLVEIKTLSTFSPSVFSLHKSEQHLNSAKVFSPLSSLSSSLNFPTVDFTCSDSDLEDLLFYLAYGSSSSSSPFPPSSSPNKQIDDLMTSQEEFVIFHQLPLHVFSSLFSFYYFLY